MYLQDFDRITKYLKESRDKREEYLSKIPDDLSYWMSDNEYSNSIGLDCDFLSQELFGELYDDLTWYLYEWKPGYEIFHEGVNYIINTHEDYVESCKQIYNLPMKA